MATKSVKTTKRTHSRDSRADPVARRTERKSAGDTSSARKRTAAKQPRGASSAPTRSTATRKRKGRPYVVRNSPIHGRGVFAARQIRKGEDIIEYRGRRISTEEADELPDSDPDNAFHTFLFELNDGRVIDAARGGNAARWINHSCQPNCEPYEDEDCRVFIAAKRTIRPGEELGYDYKLHVPGRRSARMLANYACRCGAPRCRGTMVDPKKK
jgi:SET domain-containing protein